MEKFINNDLVKNNADLMTEAEKIDSKLTQLLNSGEITSDEYQTLKSKLKSHLIRQESSNIMKQLENEINKGTFELVEEDFKNFFTDDSEISFAEKNQKAIILKETLADMLNSGKITVDEYQKLKSKVDSSMMKYENEKTIETIHGHPVHEIPTHARGHVAVLI